MEIYHLGDMEAEDYRCTLLVPVKRIERVPINKYRRSALGSAPFVLIGSVMGLLISGANDTKTMLIAALVGGGLAWLLSGASVVFLLICLISDSEGPWVLPAALGCSVLSSLFSIVRSAGEIKEEKAKKNK